MSTTEAPGQCKCLCCQQAETACSAHVHPTSCSMMYLHLHCKLTPPALYIRRKNGSPRALKSLMAALNKAATCGVDASTKVRRTPIRAPCNLQQADTSCYLSDARRQRPATLKFYCLEQFALLTVPTGQVLEQHESVTHVCQESMSSRQAAAAPAPASSASLTGHGLQWRPALVPRPLQCEKLCQWCHDSACITSIAMSQQLLC